MTTSGGGVDGGDEGGGADGVYGRDGGDGGGRQPVPRYLDIFSSQGRTQFPFQILLESRCLS